MSRFTSKLSAVVGLVGLVTGTLLIGAAGAASATTTSTAATGPTVYQAKIVNQHVVLGPQSAPTLLMSTIALPAGKYLVDSTVQVVTAGGDQVVCAIGQVPHGNDGVFGTASNPGTGMFYGTAAMTAQRGKLPRRPGKALAGRIGLPTPDGGRPKPSWQPKLATGRWTMSCAPPPPRRSSTSLFSRRS